MEQEIFKNIPGYEGLYQVSNYGNVKSIERFYKSKGYSYFLKGRILKYFIKRGYHSVILCKNGNTKAYVIHRLVAQAFLGLDINNIDIKVCHKNDDKTNNNSYNLFLGSQKDNIQDCINKGRRNIVMGESHGGCKYSERQVVEAKKLLKLGMKGSDVSLCTGIDGKNISFIKTERSWKHIKV